jgi:hypothetical protein
LARERRRGARLIPLLLASVLVGPCGRGGAAPPKAGSPEQKLSSTLPPFDPNATTPHTITFQIDTAPARGILALLTGAPGASATLQRLKASPAALAAVKSENLSPDDFFGRLVGAAAGTPDPTFSSYNNRAPFFSALLDAMEKDGPGLGEALGRRVASLLPASRPVSASVVCVPFLGLSGFAEVTAVREGETLYLVAELPRIMGDALAAPPPREAFLKVLREVSSVCWRTLFETNFKKPPVWSDEKTPDFDALLSRAVAEGPATLFLIPDDFFPISSLFAEPVARAFRRWEHAVEGITDPKAKESRKGDILAESTRGDFWARSAAIVGAQMTDAIIRLVGRDVYLMALDAGPRAVATLYVTASKGTGLPDLGKPARKELEKKPKP